MKFKTITKAIANLVLIAFFYIPNNAIAACDSPTQLQASSNGTSVNFTWSGNGTSFLIEVENTVTNVKVIPETTVISPYTATLSNGNYKFKIRTVCGKDKSNWSDWTNFIVGGSTNPGGGTSPTCDLPTGLTANPTATGATLSWTGIASSYQIEVENTATDVKVVPEQTATSPFSVTLAAGNYKFKIRSVCSGNKSDWSSWVNFTIGGGTTPTDPSGGSGGSTPTACNLPTGLTASPTATGATLSWTGTASSYQIEVENTATDVKVVPEQTATSPFIVTLAAGNYKFKVRSVCIGNKSDWSVWVNFAVGGGSTPTDPTSGTGGSTPTACNLPSGLTASPTATGATLSWTGTATSYQIEVENTATDVKVVPEQTATSPFSVTLAAGNYKFKVRSVCNGNKSDWSAWVNFTVGGGSTPTDPSGGTGGSTPTACNLPSGLTASPTATGATLSWTGTATSYQIEVENTATDVKVVPEQTATSPFSVTLAAGNYKFKIRSVCSGNKSDWSAWVNFTVGGGSTPTDPSGGSGGSTPTACNLPTGLTASPTATGATLSWTGTASSYQIEVENTATDVKVVPEQTATSPFSVTLAAGNYKFKIRSVCSGNKSDWSAWVNFTVGGGSTPTDPSGGTGGGTPVVCNIPGQLASSVSGNDVKLFWVSDGTNFQIELEKRPNDSTILDEVSVSNPFVTNLPNGSYKFKVRSICNSTKSDWSTWSFFSIGAEIDNGGANPTIPVDTTCKTNLNVSIVSAKDTSLTLRWKSAGKNATYTIEVESEETTNTFRFKQEDYKDTSILVLGLIPGTQYKIEITTNCGAGISANPGILQTSTPLVNSTQPGGASKFICDAPAGLAVQINENSFLINWLASQGGRTYRIEIESQENTPAYKNTIAVSTNSFLFNTSLAAGIYKIKVKANCQFGQSNWSSFITIRLVNPIQAVTVEQRVNIRKIEVNVFPNPASDYLTFKSENQMNTPVQMQILNVQGQVVSQYKNIQIDAINKIPVHHLIPGMYYIKIQSGYLHSVNKFMIAR